MVFSHSHFSGIRIGSRSRRSLHIAGSGWPRWPRGSGWCRGRRGTWRPSWRRRTCGTGRGRGCTGRSSTRPRRTPAAAIIAGGSRPLLEGRKTRNYILQNNWLFQKWYFSGRAIKRGTARSDWGRWMCRTTRRTNKSICSVWGRRGRRTWSNTLFSLRNCKSGWTSRAGRRKCPSILCRTRAYKEVGILGWDQKLIWFLGFSSSARGWQLRGRNHRWNGKACKLMFLAFFEDLGIWNWFWIGFEGVENIFDNFEILMKWAVDFGK